MNKIMKAALWAAEIHKNQRRKGKNKNPYINHLLEVAELVTEAGFKTDDMIIAALLHDSVEDQNVTLTEIESRFGLSVAALVSEMTDDKELPKLKRKRLQIVNAPHKSRDGSVIKIADKISNLRDLIRDPPVGWTKERIVEYIDWSIAVKDALGFVDETLEREFKNAIDAANAAYRD